MKMRVALTVLLTSAAILASSGADATRTTAAYLKIGDLMAGAGGARGYPDHLVVTNVQIGRVPVETCADVQDLNNKYPENIGRVSARIGRTDAYVEVASVRLREQAKSRRPISTATLSIEHGGRRCSVDFAKLSDLAVTERGNYDEISLRFEEFQPNPCGDDGC